MHKSHLVGCAVGIVVALGVVALTGGGTGSLGLVFAVLVCPVAMLVAMRFLMGSEVHRASNDVDAAQAVVKGRS